MKRAELHQKLRRQYLQETGKSGPVTTTEVAKYAVDKGWLKLPEPTNPLTRLSDDLAKSWREEVRHDESTGRPYRANHAVVETHGGKQRTLWGDIDEAPRPFMQKAFIQRREQIVGDCYQLTNDADHYNSTHPTEEPIQIPLDFTEDVEERKFADESGEENAA
ncbi:hypothetical protein [Comamonas sp. JC664]|uniref:hypothetical protein n=1 Tax=Comamonas sp. JC664 TaxID=2801917 RepID=UPI0017495071|nr:hypothetical protein [Comamonas sp. JC664]MBL0698955.1 hypothetical protein [Comamonas sp. JC664]GHG79760.1 hypothetical protein GCM10012319_31940 [Comamonas sp. KCTC 72670]